VSHPGEALAFENVVDEYDTARPSYPPALFDALPGLSGARVLELGSGTGIATRELLARGAVVVASDLGPKMLQRNKSRTPTLGAMVARAEALPVRTGSVDIVCGAQMWHWVDKSLGNAEVRRVLRPGGYAAFWWNEPDSRTAEWWLRQQKRLEAANPVYSRTYRDQDWDFDLSGVGAVTGPLEFPWQRTLDLDTYASWLRSKSYVEIIPAPERERFIAEETASMLSFFPDGQVVEPFRTLLWLART
jgi:SAM-dependent methyltransferase